MQFISYENDAFKFSGVWQTNNEGEFVSYGTATFCEVGFTGGECEIVGHTTKTVEFFMDDEPVTYEKTEKGYKFTVENGRHAIKLRLRQYNHFHLLGINIADGEEVFKTKDKPYVHYIGDSITYAYPGFAEGSALNLGVDYSIVAQGGMALTDGWGWYTPPTGRAFRRGMESTYFLLEFGLSNVTTPYKFERVRMPDVIVVFLGTNDYLDAPIDEERGNINIFARNYVAFLKKIRKLYPDAPILMLQALSDKYCRVRGIAAAYEAVKEAVDNVILLPSNEWGVEICDDGTHPSTPGFKFMGEKLAEELKKYLKI